MMNVRSNPENPRKITLVQGNSNHFDVANVTDGSKWFGVQVHKTETGKSDGAPLQGVVFDVYADQACTQLVETLTGTDEKGSKIFCIYG